MTSSTALATCASLALVAGCADDFDPYYRIESLRVLAIAADPPSLVEGESAAIDALAVTSAADPDLSYRWTWCPLPTNGAGNFACAVTEAQARAALGAAGDQMPAFDLGDDPSAELPYPAAREAVAGLCESVRRMGVPSFGVELSCDDHFPIQVKLEVGDGVDSVVAVKSIDLELLADVDGSSRNNNPAIEDMSLMGSTERERANEISLDIDIATSSEPYTEVPLDGEAPVERRERLVISWFTDSGELEEARTSFIAGEIDIETARKNRWTPSSRIDHPAPDARIWSVLRDNRGGVTWAERTVNLGESQ